MLGVCLKNKKNTYLSNDQYGLIFAVQNLDYEDPQ